MNKIIDRPEEVKYIFVTKQGYMTSTSAHANINHRSEKVAREYLLKLGFKYISVQHRDPQI